MRYCKSLRGYIWNFNIFKKYEKIYVSFDNIFINFNNDIKENKYKLLKDEISDSACKIKLKEDMKSEESKYQELIEKVGKKLNDFSLEKVKTIKKKIINKKMKDNIIKYLYNTYDYLNNENINLEKELSDSKNKECNEKNDLKKELESLKKIIDFITM